MEPLNEKRTPIRDILASREVPKKIETPRKAALEPRRVVEFAAQKTETTFFNAFRKLRFGIFNGFVWKITAGVIALVVVGGIAVGVFSSVIVTIAERTEAAHIDTLVAVGNGTDIAHELVVVEDAVLKGGKSSGVEDVANRATGRIVVYNAYGASVQQLVRRTRFAAPDGKIFRLKETAFVPGAATVNGTLEAGALEVDVIADQPGDAYNIELTDFTIPGFKGSAKYDKFYARSKTPMSGGFIGRAAVVRDEDVAVASQSLEQVLKNKLDAAFAAKIKEGFIVPDGALRYDIVVKSIEPAVGARGDSFEVRLAGTLAGFSVKRADVEHALAIKYGKVADGVSPEMKDFDELTVRADKLDFEKKTMALAVKGDARFVWPAPIDDLKKELIAAAGASGRNAVFESYPQIRQASISYHPPWWRFFPGREGKIIIQESASPSD